MPCELAEWINENACQHRLNGLTVGRGIVHKDTGDENTKIGLRPKDTCDPTGNDSLPVRPGQKVEAGLVPYIFPSWTKESVRW